IDIALAAGEVPRASAHLRRYLECAAGEIADSVVARTPHRLDNSHDLGDILPNAVGRMNDLLKRAVKSAKAWENAGALAAAEARQAEFKERVGRAGVEQWAINKMVHYNAWADLTPGEFQDVVEAYKALLGSFRCDGCGAWLRVMPRLEPEMLK